jgi:hypothetical protein
MVQLLKFRKVFSPRLSDLLQAQTEEAPRGFAAIKENQKAKISALGRGPDWGGIFRGWPQSKPSSMTQFLSGAGNWPARGIFAARKEMGL